MKKVLAVSLMVLGSLTIASVPPLYAQAPTPAADVTTAPAATAAPATPAAGAATPAASEEDSFSFGKVVSIADGVITVKEYDFTKDADVESAYAVTTETEFGNISGVADLKTGDDIVIDYIEKDGKRVVTTLVKEEKSTEAVPGEGEAAATDTAPAADTAAAPVAAVSVNAASPVQP